MNDVARLKAKWDERYRDARPEDAEPAFVLQNFLHLLPQQGNALDLACGLGANALLLAQRGLVTEAWDLSPVAINKLQALARRKQLPLQARVRDVTSEPPDQGSFDVIVVTHFLDRLLVPRLIAALRPQGLLFYQTFTVARVDDSGPVSGHYRLTDNELLELFRGLRLLAYREEARVGDLRAGWRNQAMLIGQKCALSSNVCE